MPIHSSSIKCSLAATIRLLRLSAGWRTLRKLTSGQKCARSSSKRTPSNFCIWMHRYKVLPVSLIFANSVTRFAFRSPNPVERLVGDAVLAKEEAQLGRVFLHMTHAVQLGF